MGAAAATFRITNCGRISGIEGTIRRVLSDRHFAKYWTSCYRRFGFGKAFVRDDIVEVSKSANEVSGSETAVTGSAVCRQSSLWRFPILICADYNSGTATWYALTCFTAMVIDTSFCSASQGLQERLRLMC